MGDRGPAEISNIDCIGSSGGGRGRSGASSPDVSVVIGNSILSFADPHATAKKKDSRKLKFENEDMAAK